MGKDVVKAGLPVLPVGKEREFTYLSLLLMTPLDRDIIPEVLYVLENNVFLALVDFFSGQNVKIPSKVEFRRCLMAVVYFYEVEVRGRDEGEVCREYEIDGFLRKTIMCKLGKLKEFMKGSGFCIPEEFLKLDFSKQFQSGLVGRLGVSYGIKKCKLGGSKEESWMLHESGKGHKPVAILSSENVKTFVEALAEDEGVRKFMGDVLRTGTD